MWGKKYEEGYKFSDDFKFGSDQIIHFGVIHFEC